MRAVAVVCVLAGVLLAGVQPASAGGVQGRSVVQSGGSFVGYGVDNTTGQDQTLTKNIKPGKTKTFIWVVLSTGLPGMMTLEGSGGSECFRVRYFDYAGDDLTATLVQGETFGVPAGSLFSALAIQVQIKAKSCAAPGSSKTVNLDVSPAIGPLDRARARVTVT